MNTNPRKLHTENKVIGIVSLQTLAQKNKKISRLKSLGSNAQSAVQFTLSGCLGGRASDPACCAITATAELSGS